MSQLIKDVPRIDARSTLAEALSRLDQAGDEVLCVQSSTNKTVCPMVSVLNRQRIGTHTALAMRSHSSQ